ncbi:hypothetical protein VTL71DRAFT_16305 [Oculimacula yallundae]|uniref:Uncharacterized protein n=1 Tax=Oculimacula yallundae TaxID=86028 RepID=A0ABR4CFB0_9HELO
MEISRGNNGASLIKYMRLARDRMPMKKTPSWNLTRKVSACSAEQTIKGLYCLLFSFHPNSNPVELLYIE